MTQQSILVKSRNMFAGILGSTFGKNVAWVAGLSSIERISALLQTIIIARVLGITEYGVYGLLFGTIGFTASIIGMQMGLTATVFIARYKESDKAKAKLVIQYVNKFSLMVSAVFFIGCIPFSQSISVWLLSSEQYMVAIIIACVFIGGSIISGVQDGIAQGFEDFKSIARIKIITSLCTLLAVYPSTSVFGLKGALYVLLGGLFLKYVLLNSVVKRSQFELNFPCKGAGLKFKELIFGFSVPSMLTSLFVGLASWYGMYLLSRQPSGFDEVAIVNVGVQWRGPLLLISSSIGVVAIPTFSRMKNSGNTFDALQLKVRLLWINGLAALTVVLMLALLAEPLLGIYGANFIKGKFVFLLILATSIPQVMVQVYMQNLVGVGKMWLQLWLHLPFFMCLFIGFVFLIPEYLGLGYAVTMVVSTLIFAIYSVGILHFYKIGQ